MANLSDRVSVRKAADGHYEVLNGHHRLQAALDLGLPVTVRDIESGEVLQVHNLDGKLVVVSEVTSLDFAAGRHLE